MEDTRKAVASTTTKKPAQMPWWMLLPLLGIGGFVMLVAAGVIAVDPSTLHAPRWVLFGCGAVFLLGGILGGLVPVRYRHPAAYTFAVALLLTSFAAVAGWVALFAEGGTASMGGVPVEGPVADGLGRALAGLGAVLLGAFAVRGWAQWARALVGAPVDLD